MENRSELKQKANAVFEGGGVKGIGIAGALSVAGRYYDWVNVAGTSAGALIAALTAAGYSSEEITEMVSAIDYGKMEDPDPRLNWPILGLLLGLKFNLGIFKGDYIEQWVREKLLDKGVRSFGDLTVPGVKRRAASRSRLRVIASDITAGKMLILPQDIARYGIDPDYFEVAKAVRMSISIPFFFQPVVLKHAHNGREESSYVVDGGVLSNFPVWLFDDELDSRGMPTFGFKLTGPGTDRPNIIKGPLSMLKALFSTMIEAHDSRYIEEMNFDRTISIPTGEIRATDFNISAEQVQALFQSGVKAAEEFFQGWDYRVYMRKYGK